MFSVFKHVPRSHSTDPEASGGQDSDWPRCPQRLPSPAILTPGRLDAGHVAHPAAQPAGWL